MAPDEIIRYKGQLKSSLDQVNVSSDNFIKNSLPKEYDLLLSEIGTLNTVGESEYMDSSGKLEESLSSAQKRFEQILSSVIWKLNVPQVVNSFSDSLGLGLEQEKSIDKYLGGAKEVLPTMNSIDKGFR